MRFKINGYSSRPDGPHPMKINVRFPISSLSGVAPETRFIVKKATKAQVPSLSAHTFLQRTISQCAELQPPLVWQVIYLRPVEFPCSNSNV